MLVRLRRRLPVRLRQQWRLLAACAAFLAVVTVVFGGDRVRPLVASAEQAAAPTVTEDIAGLVDVFDGSRPHSVEITFDDAAYQRMLAEFRESGEKAYLEADLVIDGTTIPSVGVRLKGNSTLMGLRRAGAGGPAGGAVGGGRGGPPGGGGGLAGAGVSADAPETLPWLIQFDEYVSGRRYQGHKEIAVRPAGRTSSTGLNEALALALVRAAGEPVQDSAYSTVTVNGRTSTRLLLENPDSTFAADQLGSAGVLYKALPTGQFSYRGEDPLAYQDSFDQVTGKGSQDLQPVVNLIKWVQQSSDAEFAAGLADRLDVRSFARYLALHNLLLNFDDMSGPGQNYYLWYDRGSGRFTVVTWDLNLALSGNPAQGPYDAGGFGGGPGGAGFPGGERDAGVPPGGVPPGGFPGAGQQPGGPPGDAAGPGAGPVPGRVRGGNRLKERFLATPAFKAGYEDAYRQLYRSLYADGTALRLLTEVSESVRRTLGADQARVAADVASLRGVIESRTASLAGNPVITGG